MSYNSPYLYHIPTEGELTHAKNYRAFFQTIINDADCDKENKKDAKKIVRAATILINWWEADMGPNPLIIPVELECFARMVVGWAIVFKDEDRQSFREKGLNIK